MLVALDQKCGILLPEIQKYGCLFLCFADASTETFKGTEGARRLNALWKLGITRGYISGDLNMDGDFDDVGEAEVLDHTKVARELFKLNVHYDGMHHDPKDEIPKDVYLVFGQYWYKSGHFVRLNNRKEVIFDSFGFSNTVKYGKLKSMRYYYAD